MTSADWPPIIKYGILLVENDSRPIYLEKNYRKSGLNCEL